jgi:hypothetical protein
MRPGKLLRPKKNANRPELAAPLLPIVGLDFG